MNQKEGVANDRIISEQVSGSFYLANQGKVPFFPQWQTKQRGLEWRLHTGILGGSAQALGNCSCLQRCLEPVPKCLFPHVGLREKKPHAKEFSVLQTVRQVIFFSLTKRYGVEKTKIKKEEGNCLAGLSDSSSQQIYIHFCYFCSCCHTSLDICAHLEQEDSPTSACLQHLSLPRPSPGQGPTEQQFFYRDSLFAFTISSNCN